MLLLLFKDHINKVLHNPWLLSGIVHVLIMLLVLLVTRSFNERALLLGNKIVYRLSQVTKPSRHATQARIAKHVVTNPAQSVRKQPVAKVKKKEIKPPTNVSPLKKEMTKVQNQKVHHSVPLNSASPKGMSRQDKVTKNFSPLKKVAPTMAPMLPGMEQKEIEKEVPLLQEQKREEVVEEIAPLDVKSEEGVLSVIDAVLCYEFKKYWQAPDGIACSCTWIIHISPQGKCIKLVWCDKEPPPAVAIALRAACNKIAYPQQVWGKTKLVSI
jgi:hypothetical protein